MTQAIDKQQMIIDELKKLSPEKQQEVLNFIEFLQFKDMQKQDIQHQEEKEPISAYEAAKEFAGCVGGDPDHREKQVSFLEAAKEFIGCVDGGPGDLAINKKYLEGFGR
ncbi:MULTISPECIES: DUF2281 domain-containing protein [unclassified Nostoc]|uniref:DUF2281 domain-containing protein n=1 Tax=unclassified Nostoc TaxID=2593658 RepID=UPI002AD305AA|nr:DUF2281 domain-containing protein [Nostoc sp. DedQUE03]MDZ7976416.1 DUF2281 domain-containing protein [Nostoc sp. DedQUE03]MDZ8047587.1 DUF2281 domain-containing protein [Nostoc sp. DedQUE02]